MNSQSTHQETEETHTDMNLVEDEAEVSDAENGDLEFPDDIDEFVAMITARLRKLPDHVRIEVQQKIIAILNDAVFRRYNRNEE